MYKVVGRVHSGSAAARQQARQVGRQVNPSHPVLQQAGVAAPRRQGCWDAQAAQPAS